MQKINLLKEMKQLYMPASKEPTLVEVPVCNYLMVDGQGDPNTSESYKIAIEALFSVAYAAKFMLKKSERAIDYGVMPLQCLWWGESSDFMTHPKDSWKWTAMILQPDFLSNTDISAAVEQVRTKKKHIATDLVRFESYTEGRCAQILHIGPFSEEGPTVARLHDFIASTGDKPNGKHHELYLSDIRKAAPDKWKTILRQPIA